MPKPEVEAAVADDVDHRQILGRVERVVQRQTGHRGADAHALRRGGERRGRDLQRAAMPYSRALCSASQASSKPRSSTHFACSSSLWMHRRGPVPRRQGEEMERAELHAVNLPHASSNAFLNNLLRTANPSVQQYDLPRDHQPCVSATGAQVAQGRAGEDAVVQQRDGGRL